jgi:hypothetical protein
MLVGGAAVVPAALAVQSPVLLWTLLAVSVPTAAIGLLGTVVQAGPWALSWVPRRTPPHTLPARPPRLARVARRVLDPAAVLVAGFAGALARAAGRPPAIVVVAVVVGFLAKLVLEAVASRVLRSWR